MLAVALSENKPLEEATLLASAAGALRVTQRGARQSLPWLEDLESFIRN
jgi:sugar/nucleoside kinase (ribokinase family)